MARASHDMTAVEALEPRRLLSAGDLDPSFNASGTPGWVRTDMGHTYDAATSVAVQSDGKIVASGFGGKFAVARYLPDGTLDAGFGTGGRVFVNDLATADAVAVDPFNGKVYVAGTGFFAPGQWWDLYVVRLNPNGSVDTSYGTDGRVRVNLGYSEVPSDMALIGNGDVVVSVQGGKDFTFATVGETGNVSKVDIDLGSDDEQANTILYQPDGKIALGGYTTGAGGRHVFALARQNGIALDGGWGDLGKVIVDVPGDFGGDEVKDLAMDGIGRLVAAGSGGRLNFAMFREDGWGRPDPTFGDGGIVQTPGAAEANSGIEDIEILSDGRIVAAGFGRNDNQWDFALARYTANGELDATFAGGAGHVTNDFTPWDIGHALCLTPDGDYIVAGEAGEPNVAMDFAVARYQGDPQPEGFATVDGHGVVTVAGTSGDDAIEMLMDRRQPNPYSGGGDVIVRLNGEEQRFPFALVSSVRAEGGEGNDSFTLRFQTLRGAVFDGGPGQDVAVFETDLYNDDVAVHADNVGNRYARLGYSEVERVVVNGQQGNDVLRADNDLPFAVTLNGGGGYNTFYGARGDVTLVGGDATDTFWADDGFRNVIDGGGGDDLAQTDPSDVVTRVERYLNSHITGTVYEDVNGNGVRDPGEGGVPGFIVYYDINGNNRRDSGEDLATSNGAFVNNYRTGGLAPGNYRLNLEMPAGWARSPANDVWHQVTVPNNADLNNVDFGVRHPGGATVAGRHLFYNNSAYDGRNEAVNAADDGAIATDKVALFPGQPTTFENLSSYSRGLNGIMVDFNYPGQPPQFDASDFTFRMGRSDDPSGWSAAPTPRSVTTRVLNGAQLRVTVVWSDNQIRNRWLQVTVKSTAHTNLSRPDVFYFGNLVGEVVVTGSAIMVVNAVDLGQVRANQLAPGTTITSRYDVNRDGAVNALDLSVVRGNQVGSLPIFTTPTTASAAAPLTLRRDDELLA